MDYANWPPYIQKKYALCQTHYGSLDPQRDAATKQEQPRLCAKDMLDWMYSILTTLDAKSSALMRLNGVLIAAAAFLLGLFRRSGGTILSTTYFDALVITTSALLSALSIGVCLFVVNVSWPFLDKIRKTSEGKFDCTPEIIALAKACTFRQRAYRLAWYISLIASIDFLVEFSSQTIHVIMVV